jgi:hypothetical protein
MDSIKTENDMYVPRENGSIGMKTKEVYIPSAISLVKDEPEVSHALKLFFFYRCTSTTSYAFMA